MNVDEMAEKLKKQREALRQVNAADVDQFSKYEKQIADLQRQNALLRANPLLDPEHASYFEFFTEPCAAHSNENTPPFDMFAERYSGHCTMCLVDAARELIAFHEFRKEHELADMPGNEKYSTWLMKIVNMAQAAIDGGALGKE